jgi:hypothetical protein
MILINPMSHHSNNNHLNNGDTDDPINHRREHTTATRAATMTPTATATTTAEHKISSHVNQQQQLQQHYYYNNSSAAAPFYSQNFVPNIGETYPHHVADAAAQVWNEWIHEEDQTLQSGSSNNSNSSASMSVTEEALRNMQQQQQQRCYNDRIHSPNRLHRFSAESPLISTLPFTNQQMQQFPKRLSAEFIAQNRYAQQDAYRSYQMLQPILQQQQQCSLQPYGDGTDLQSTYRPLYYHDSYCHRALMVSNNVINSLSQTPHTAAPQMKCGTAPTGTSTSNGSTLNTNKSLPNQHSNRKRLPPPTAKLRRGKEKAIKKDDHKHAVSCQALNVPQQDPPIATDASQTTAPLEEPIETTIVVTASEDSDDVGASQVPSHTILSAATVDTAGPIIPEAVQASGVQSTDPVPVVDDTTVNVLPQPLPKSKARPPIKRRARSKRIKAMLPQPKLNAPQALRLLSKDDVSKAIQWIAIPPPLIKPSKKALSRKRGKSHLVLIPPTPEPSRCHSAITILPKQQHLCTPQQQQQQPNATTATHHPPRTIAVVSPPICEDASSPAPCGVVDHVLVVGNSTTATLAAFTPYPNPQLCSSSNNTSIISTSVQPLTKMGLAAAAATTTSTVHNLVPRSNYDYNENDDDQSALMQELFMTDEILSLSDSCNSSSSISAASFNVDDMMVLCDALDVEESI